MNRDWNVFDGPPPLDTTQHDARRERVRATAAVLGTPHAEAWLMARLAAEPPSYRPGDSFDQTAHREGRKDLLRDLLAELAEARAPDPTNRG